MPAAEAEPMNGSETIEASAPGKLIVIGEYAVLEGAPALVLALDRRVRVRVGPGNGLLSAPQMGVQLDCRNLGNQAAMVDQASRRQLGLTGRFIPGLLRAHGIDMTELGSVNIEIDSSELYFDHGDGWPVKLGLGSSAAVSVALARGLSALLGIGPDWRDLRAWIDHLLPIYRRALGSRASGADLAASLHGGAIVYRDHSPGAEIASAAWPKGLQWSVIWTGQSAQTVDFVERFAEWRASDQDSGKWIGQLGFIARSASAVGINAGELLAAMELYAAALTGMAEAAGLEIMTPMHRAFRELAARREVIYKSCGAGGGDLGIAVAESAGQLQSFLGEVREMGGFPIESKISGGVRLDPPVSSTLQSAACRPAH